MLVDLRLVGRRREEVIWVLKENIDWQRGNDLVHAGTLKVVLNYRESPCFLGHYGDPIL